MSTAYKAGARKGFVRAWSWNRDDYYFDEFGKKVPWVVTCLPCWKQEAPVFETCSHCLATLRMAIPFSELLPCKEIK